MKKRYTKLQSGFAKRCSELAVEIRETRKRKAMLERRK